MSATQYTHDPTLHRVFGHVVNVDPLSLLESVMNEEPTEIQPTRVTQAVDYLRDHHLRPGDPTLELHSSLLDVRMIMRTAIDNDDTLDIQEALGAATHERSARLMTKLALCPSEYYREQIWGDPSILYIQSREYLAIAPGILPDHRIGKGCPFAGDNPEQRLYPIFLKYASWAMQFCTYDYYEEKSH